MLVRFRLPYFTSWGQRLEVRGAGAALGDWHPDRALRLTYDPSSGFWEQEVDVAADTAELRYKYVLVDNGVTHWEGGPDRVVALTGESYGRVLLDEFWRVPQLPEYELLTNAFTQAIFRRPAESPCGPGTGRAARSRAADAAVRFSLGAPRVQPGQCLCILGSDEALGAWDNRKALVLSDADFPYWSADVALVTPDKPVLYKYGFWDPQAKRCIDLEAGPDRVLPPLGHRDTLRWRHDEQFRQTGGPWRGAGVALPVFALRSQQGLGVGEFPDLNLLVDWAVEAGLQLVQVLPINDTTATHTWVDSYPYAAISVFALHPQYLRLQDVAELQDPTLRAELDQLREELNGRDFVDYEPVTEAKWRFLRHLYQQEKAAFLADPAYQRFFQEQQAWLAPYAVFSGLRERFGTVDFRQWPAAFQQPGDWLPALLDPAHSEFDEFGLHLFTQFHLDKQLVAAVDYARSKGVVLKGDLPIGIYRHSVEAWTQPELYHLDQQAGAPPDDFSVTGQNWRFPTYNWEKMAEDNYAWWRQRLTHLSRYFDALRIDHILGFFRIWEIPAHAVEGLLGHFSPALPLHRHEVEQRLGWFDYDRLAKPYIRWHILEELFGAAAGAVRDEFLDEGSHGAFRFREFVDTQRKVEAVFEQQLTAAPAEEHDHLKRLREGLYRLHTEVLFVEADGSNGEYWHPRITVDKSRTFRDLDDQSRRRMQDLYVDFFFRRHEDFWREQGLVKLPAIRYATNMLIFGEDLGMVPASVPGVMRQLGMLGLNIQRMPAATGIEFSHPNDAAYLSVVSPSCHDMSTVRGWWEEDHERTQRFFEQLLGHGGQAAPYFCESWASREVVVQHLYSPAMWAIFPLQDLVALNDQLRRQNPLDEQVNVPSNPEHFWKYRFHLPLEQLGQAEGFNQQIHDLVKQSGR
ncbi:4-alpha-glucanotransferase [Hymenobacter busanensis]|uniref:4-alpha-glucanotransferase n=1 Tax=Hymenobacter busanensis TaxID=2607656 RepID=A0A7L4ZYE2_9BACT|nr:4-alpha-glucanotransferase [Hymenobacter busanensis]KAA9333034.1 4-alpha-glucanotransferase [Hymenobacter busanensis]QHJ08291.1 4-alpha-glucanotransferase [Hymenobacter busanensis]